MYYESVVYNGNNSQALCNNVDKYAYTCSISIDNVGDDGIDSTRVKKKL